MNQTLGKRIMKNRKQLGLTQDQLAEKLGVTAQAVSKWENDLSCPDISVIPLLANIFGISTDELLGVEESVHVAEVVSDSEQAENGKHDVEFSLHAGRKSALFFAILVICVGGIYLLSNLLFWDISFWSILWTTSLLIFGLSGLYPKFSFFHLGCTLIGGYCLFSRIVSFPFNLDGRIVLACAILLFGISLLFDGLKKAKKPFVRVAYTDKSGQKHIGKTVNDYHADGNGFHFNSSFGSVRQAVTMALLEYGHIHTSFGEFTVDLSGVKSLSEHAAIKAECNFGELHLLVPRRYEVKAESSVSLAAFHINGVPDAVPEGVLHLDASVSFGEIQVSYI